jgi:hypothetical protein
MSRVSFALNSFHKARQLTKLIILKYRSGYLKLGEEEGLNFVPTIGFSTMKMLLFIRRSLSSTLWPNN